MGRSNDIGAFITSTDTDPHTWHFAVGGQHVEEVLAIAAFTSTDPDGLQLTTYRACSVPHWCSLTDLANNLGIGLDFFGPGPVAMSYSSHIWHGEPLEISKPTYFTIDLDFGSYSKLFIEDYPEADLTSFMQTSPSVTPTPTLVTVHLRGMHGLSLSLQVAADQSVFEILANHWPFTTRPHSDLLALHPVESPPSFVRMATDSFFLMEFNADRFDQTHIDDVLILVTVKDFVRGTSWDSDGQRCKVLWGPKTATRERILGFLRAQWFCEGPTVSCELFFNELAWQQGDTALRHFEPGDHLRLNIISSQERWCDLVYAETSERQRRIYESSSSPDPPPEDAADPATGHGLHGQEEAEEEEPEDPEEETLSPYTVRYSERSRSRSPVMLQLHANLHPNPESQRHVAFHWQKQLHLSITTGGTSLGHLHHRKQEAILDSRRSLICGSGSTLPRPKSPGLFQTPWNGTTVPSHGQNSTGGI